MKNYELSKLEKELMVLKKIISFRKQEIELYTEKIKFLNKEGAQDIVNSLGFVHECTTVFRQKRTLAVSMLERFERTYDRKLKILKHMQIENLNKQLMGME